MTNHEHVLTTFDEFGDKVVPIRALEAAMVKMWPMADVLARQLIQIALADGVITMDGHGDIRRA